MISKFLTTILVVMFANAASAQTVQIRTGEHQGFTRLALTMSERTTWKLQQSGIDATLVFDSSAMVFDTSAAFDRITRDRLVSIGVDSKTPKLNLELGCECKLRSFWLTDKMLVIDIVDDETVVATAKPSDKPVTSEEIQEKKKLQALLVGSAFKPSTPKANRFNPQKSADPFVKTMSESGKTELPNASRNQEQLTETRDRLLQQIGRAATQGLLTPKSGLPSQKYEEQQKPDIRSNEGDAEIAPAMIGKTGLSTNINMKAQTSIDRDFLSSQAYNQQTTEISHCLDAKQVEVSAWGTQAPFSTQISAVRPRLTGEFDKTNHDTVVELTRLYIYFGFGIEANQTLTLISGEPHDFIILRDLAEIIEKGHARPGSILLGQLGCETPVALWSALASQALPKDIPIETNAIMRAFSALPAHLRRHLGPTLSRRFLQAGYHEVAEKLLRIVNRNKGVIPPDASILQAEMHISDGDRNTGESTLDEVIKGNFEPSAEALLQLIESRFESGSEISFELAQLAGAFAQENRGSDIGHDLSMAYIASLASSGAFDQAYRELSRLKTQLSPEDIQAVQNQVMAILTRNADDLTFLRYVLSDQNSAPSTLNPDVTNAMARRLLEAGFFQAAGQLIEASVKGPPGVMRQLIQAEISLNEGRPRQAEVDLLGITDSEANLLRARARSDMGKHLAAYQLYKSNQMDAEATHSAWLAEDWDLLSKQDDPVLADVAVLIKSSPVDPEVEVGDNGLIEKYPGVLAQNRELLADSGVSRDTLTALLASKPLPEDLLE